MVKSPCSPHPAVGVTVAEEAGNGLLFVKVDVVLRTDPVEDRILLRLWDCAPAVVEEGGEVNLDDIVVPLADADR